MRVRRGVPDRGGSRRERRALAYAAFALALLAVVGLASSISVWHASQPRVASFPQAAVQAFAVVGGVVLVVALLSVWVGTPTAPPRRRKRRAPSGYEFDEIGGALWTAGKTLAAGLLALGILSLAALPVLSRASSDAHSVVGAQPSSIAGRSRSNGGTLGHSVDLVWLLVPIAVTFAAFAPAAALIRRRRLKRGREAYDEALVALRYAVRASIAALESERDPRIAILRAYAGMEQAFQNVEVVRACDETASEFLGRTIRRLPVSARAAASLTDRFEEVRYSTHRITQADREQALASLHQVERELGERP